MTLLYQGAEAKLFKDKNIVIKDRFAKTYRHPELDWKIRSSRTRREAKILQKVKEIGIPCPSYIYHNDKNILQAIIRMDLIEGDVLKNIFEKNYEKYSKMIAKNVALLHKHGIIHADLTTSNMILHNDVLHFIDFGLSFFSDKIEDKAVDLHLLKQALESKHYKVFDKAYEIILKEYKNYSESKDVLKRLEEVELRGRYKHQH